MELLARLLVGIGFVWVVLILGWGFLAGIDQPYLWFKWAADSLNWGWLPSAYLGLALFVVPMGMLTLLRDILGDPVAIWVKWAAPGAFLAIYAFFLLMALPDIGRPLYESLEALVGSVATTPPAGTGGADGTTTWLLRFGVTFVVLAGVPAVIGTVVNLATGGKGGARRR